MLLETFLEKRATIEKHLKNTAYLKTAFFTLFLPE